MISVRDLSSVFMVDEIYERKRLYPCKKDCFISLMAMR
jgi:hypothetical protein